jgi:hypothetical protein
MSVGMSSKFLVSSKKEFRGRHTGVFNSAAIFKQKLGFIEAEVIA